MEDDGDDTLEHPDGIPFPEGGIQAVEGPDGHQRVEGQGAEYLYAVFREVVRVVVEVTYHDLGQSDRTYRAILQDEGGDIHLAGGDTSSEGPGPSWIDLDYGWEEALAKVDDFLQPNPSEDKEDVSFEVVRGEETYRQLRAQMN
jgi:hypothetical protein